MRRSRKHEQPDSLRDSGTMAGFGSTGRAERNRLRAGCSRIPARSRNSERPFHDDTSDFPGARAMVARSGAGSTSSARLGSARSVTRGPAISKRSSRQTRRSRTGSMIARTAATPISTFRRAEISTSKSPPFLARFTATSDSRGNGLRASQLVSGASARHSKQVVLSRFGLHRASRVASNDTRSDFSKPLSIRATPSANATVRPSRPFVPRARSRTHGLLNRMHRLTWTT